MVFSLWTCRAFFPICFQIPPLQCNITQDNFIFKSQISPVGFKINTKFVAYTNNFKSIFGEESLARETEDPAGFNYFASTDLHVKPEKNILAINLKTYCEAMDNISRRISTSIPMSHLNVDKKDYIDFIGLWEDINKI